MVAHSSLMNAGCASAAGVYISVNIWKIVVINLPATMASSEVRFNVYAAPKQYPGEKYMVSK